MSPVRDYRDVQGTFFYGNDLWGHCHKKLDKSHKKESEITYPVNYFVVDFIFPIKMNEGIFFLCRK